MVNDTSENTSPATAQRFQVRWVIKIVLRTVVVIYLIWCALLYFMQDDMVFPATMAGQAGKPPPEAHILPHTLDDGAVYAWFMPAPGASADAPAPLVVFFHGNAELIDDQRTLAMAYLQRGWSVLLPEYRGYGNAAGKPSQTAIVADAVHFIRTATARDDVDADRLVLHGRSIGGAIAAQVAREHKPAAMILESAPANVASMAWQFGVPPLLVRNPFPTDEALSTLDVPVRLFHGTHDTIIPLRDGHRLAQVALRAELIELPCGHNDLPGPQRERYWKVIDALLQDVINGSTQSAHGENAPD